MGLVRSTTLQTNIHGMLELIPSIYPEELNAHFDSIDSKLSAFEGSTMLELAIWRSEIVKQIEGNINLLTNSLSMVDIIVPNVLSFLHDNAN